MVAMTALTCLAAAIFFEARAEPIDGQVMVAEVIMNRVEDKRYPDTVCEVVYERKAFSFTHDGMSDDMAKYNTYFDKISQDVAINLAKKVLNQKERQITSTHYHATNVKPFWTKHYDLDGKVGNHVFYTNNTPHK